MSPACQPKFAKFKPKLLKRQVWRRGYGEAALQPLSMGESFGERNSIS